MRVRASSSVLPAARSWRVVDEGHEVAPGDEVGRPAGGEHPDPDQALVRARADVAGPRAGARRRGHGHRTDRDVSRADGGGPGDLDPRAGGPVPDEEPLAGADRVVAVVGYFL